ncbi:MAG: thioredoxin domain-containing protein [Phycisphaerae bacterium]
MATEAEHKHTNHLIHATSPYLLQHAHNPVDWYEWGPEAINKAKEEDKPIFLSIGYSACHWCHVMAHESFEDELIAAILNQSFVSIKVDREERPDIDEIYMQATVNMTGHGGWPMSVFMTPEGVPFHCGTYFPTRQFEQILTRLDNAWQNDRASLTRRGSELRARIQQWANRPQAGENVIPESSVVETARMMARYFDMRKGGFRSGRNKFPPSMAMDLMLRAHRRVGDANLLAAVEVTLTRMARGGIYDHLGGGICRYSTDPDWLVPHFEKMLYDQALVSSIYLDAFQVTGNRLFQETARGIFDYVIGDLQSPEGGIYSTRDADSEGMEGKFYIWTVAQVREVLGDEDAKLFCAYYDVTETGNWFESRGHAPSGPKNILNIQKDDESFAKLHGLELDTWRRRLAGMKAGMLEARRRRVPPSLDDKILTGWNGLMIASLAKGAQVFDEPRYGDAAARAADFVLKNMVKDGKLLRTYRGGRARLTGYLSDYAFLTDGLLNLYEYSFDPRWVTESVALTDNLIERYFDNKAGGFFYTASDGEKLLARTKDADDGAIPSGNSLAAMNLLRLAIFTGNRDYREKAESIFKAFAPLVERSPSQLERLLCAVDFYYGQPKEIAVVGDPGDPNTRAMLSAIRGAYRPNKVVATASDADAAASLAEHIPLLKGKRRIDGKTTAFVCQNYNCKKPVTDVGALLKQLDARK